MRRRGFIVGLASLVAGCANDPAAMHSTAQNDDQFLPFLEFRSAEIRVDAVLLFAPYFYTTLYLLARRDRATGATSTHARIAVAYHRKERLDIVQARGQAANVLSIKWLVREGSGCRKADGCPHRDEFLVDIPEAELRQSRNTGYQFKLFTRQGNSAVFLAPKELINAVLNALDASAPTAQPARGQAQQQAKR